MASMQRQISLFFIDEGRDAVEARGWQEKPNGQQNFPACAVFLVLGHVSAVSAGVGQQLLRLRDVAVSVYLTTGRVCFQGTRRNEYEAKFEAWRARPSRPQTQPEPQPELEPEPDEAATTRLPAMPTQAVPSVGGGGTQMVPLGGGGGGGATRRSGQKSTLEECNLFLQEVEGKQGDPSLWWEQKPNTQLLARLSRVGYGNISFYTTKQTLLIQGRDQDQIRACFLYWRAERMQRMLEEEMELQRVARLQAQANREREREDRENVPPVESESRLPTDTDRDPSVCRPPPAKKRKTKETERQRERASQCLHCQRALEGGQGHSVFLGQTFCRFSGKWQCNKESCRGGRGQRRTWFMFALKLQGLPPSSPAAFPPEHFPDCLNCRENFDVELVDSCPPGERGEHQEIRTTHRPHQRQLCPLCRNGYRCPRAGLGG
uniref:Uncharacterized protein n=1 Tax=Chromera velia CCMP2878 TaxID=1169474 RepID=A0A0G4HJT3_9ALVE|eukprot:Cvel_7174.t1-p1 / transcript=Cvel_7174.t1 / gene=Cvel_7174 / organism=Chromera_velia_CCMP2878 / gene_product=hypothetical protein / transcript_product=hypothetical protein / location=Cvel_scaffold369:39007-40387(+) / protein_length=432 / sequence_SO=supercontig / SO=protein_coding / is_pseudo=false